MFGLLVYGSERLVRKVSLEEHDECLLVVNMVIVLPLSYTVKLRPKASDEVMDLSLPKAKRRK